MDQPVTAPRKPPIPRRATISKPTDTAQSPLGLQVVDEPLPVLAENAATGETIAEGSCIISGPYAVEEHGVTASAPPAAAGVQDAISPATSESPEPCDDASATNPVLPSAPSNATVIAISPEESPEVRRQHESHAELLPSPRELPSVKDADYSWLEHDGDAWPPGDTRGTDDHMHVVATAEDDVTQSPEVALPDVELRRQVAQRSQSSEVGSRPTSGGAPQGSEDQDIPRRDIDERYEEGLAEAPMETDDTEFSASPPPAATTLWTKHDFARRYPRVASLLVDTLTLAPADQATIGRRAQSLLKQLDEWEAERKAQLLAGTADIPPHARWARVQATREEVHEVLVEAMSRTPDWCECDGPLWDVWWLWKKPRPLEDTWLITQKVNHIPRTSHLTRKDSLKTALQRYSSGRGAGSAQFNLMPLTYNLPKDYVAFAQVYAERRGLWIMKTVGMSRGRGISLVQDIADVTYSAPVVLQQYIERPLIIDGRKFDLRLYVLVTQFNPLEAFISNIGFARFAASRYKADASSLTDLTVHLTNTSISETVEAGGKNKWSLESLAASGAVADWPTVWEAVMSTTLRTLVAVEGDVPHCECAFELFGFDVILDADYRPWVLEVNASPSMEMFGALDRELKPELIRDTLQLVSAPAIDRVALRQLLASVDRKGNYAGRDWGDAVRAVFHGLMPRQYGMPPPEGSSFQTLAPSRTYDKYLRAKRNAV
jgi:hypothetical protein